MAVTTRTPNPHRRVVVRMARVAASVAIATLAFGFGFGLGPTPAGAQATIEPLGAALSASASCSQGDIEITYTASGVERQITDFTAADGRVLHHYDVRVYSSEHREVEYILSQTRTPPPAGTVLAVHVTIGASPPDANTGEFFVEYRCDTRSNTEGGNNEVLSVCTGMFGTCRLSAADTLRPARPVIARPNFTG